jgi:hypothetical protein
MLTKQTVMGGEFVPEQAVVLVRLCKIAEPKAGERVLDRQAVVDQPWMTMSLTSLRSVC